jgi:YfiH family protein
MTEPVTKQALPGDWLVPDWPAPAGVRAVCTTRSGGLSASPYDSFNLGDHVGDEPAHVAGNRALFQRAIQAQPVFLNQVHGTQVLQINAATPHASQADACLSDEPGLACTIMVADCLPVLFTTTQGQVVAAAHAGWRGLVGQGGVGVLETTYECFKALAQVNYAKEAITTIAWLGPCIGPKAFEVGDEVRAAFVSHDAQAAEMFTPLAGGKWLAHLAGLARQRLAALGVTHIYGNDGGEDWCTVTQRSRFFSHRRDRVSGRFAVSIWRDR